MMISEEILQLPKEERVQAILNILKHDDSVELPEMFHHDLFDINPHLAILHSSKSDDHGFLKRVAEYVQEKTPEAIDQIPHLKPYAKRDIYPNLPVKSPTISFSVDGFDNTITVENTESLELYIFSIFLDDLELFKIQASFSLNMLIVEEVFHTYKKYLKIKTPEDIFLHHEPFELLSKCMVEYADQNDISVVIPKPKKEKPKIVLEMLKNFTICGMQEPHDKNTIKFCKKMETSDGSMVYTPKGKI